MMKKVIHVNAHHIRKNNTLKTETYPVISVKTYKENKYAKEVHIKSKDGEIVAKVVYNPKKPLSCGAKVWIETDTDVVDVEIVR